MARPLALMFVGLGLLGIAFPGLAASLVALGTPTQGRLLEARIEGIPDATNVFDPAVIAVDVEITEPGGRVRSVPAFWYRPFERNLRAGSEVLSPTGPGEWRLRCFPALSGNHQFRVLARLGQGETSEIVREEITVSKAGANRLPGGFAKVGESQQFFQTADGRALPLVGADTCWPGSRGTFDYDAWFPAMASAGWNWGRLWMAPWAFGIETAAKERLAYRLDRAWQLDHVFELAETNGLRLLLCLDFHGMFETQPDVWGGNNFWSGHPYNAANGGPCPTPRSFFTQPEARRLYQARLRYLIARYGARPGLFAWQFFNEIDNVYRLLDASEVARWHADMAAWLRTNDPWSRLRTTSLTSQSDRPEIWSIPDLDFAVYHAYSLAAPARRLSETIASMRQRYRKPVLIGEAGVDWRGWARASDPHLRGFRQLLWGGIASGSAGTSMSWWWESIHGETDVYPLYRAATNILTGTTWGKGRWEPVRFRAAPPAPSTVADPIPGAAPVEVLLPLDPSWGARLSGLLAVPGPEAAGLSAQRLNGFVHGASHPELRIPFRLNAWFADGASLVLHVNSVSDGAVLSVRVDGTETFRRSLPNKDGRWEVNNEYNEDVSVGIPPGHHTVELRNTGADWFHGDWVRLSGVRPSRYSDDWQPSPVPTGIREGNQLLVYLVAPGVEYPAQATSTHLVATAPSSLVVSNLPPGHYAAVWFNSVRGTEVGRSTGTVDAPPGTLELPVPSFAEDLVGHIFPGPRLRAGGLGSQGAFEMAIEGFRPRTFALEGTGTSGAWEPRPGRHEDGNDTLPPRIIDAEPGPGTHRMYRLRFVP